MGDNTVMETKKKWALILLMAMISILILLWWAGTQHSGSSSRLTVQTRGKGESPLPGGGISQPANKSRPGYTLSLEFDSKEADFLSDYEVAGIVTSERSGKALEGVSVSVHESAPLHPTFEWAEPIIAVNTDYEGRYKMRLTSPVLEAAVAVRKDGFATTQGPLTLLEPGAIVKNYVLRESPACVEGRVLGPGGMPVVGAMVSNVVSDVFSADLAHSQFAMALSDNGGAYALKGLPEGRVDVTASKLNFLRDSKTVTLAAGACEQVNFGLRAGCTIALVVRSRRGSVIPTAFARIPAPHVLMGSGSRRADQNGKIEFTIAPNAESFEATVEAKGYTQNVVVIGCGLSSATVELEEAGLLTGRVYSTTGPVGRALVTVLGTRVSNVSSSSGFGAPGSVPEGSVQTGDDGSFSIPLSHPPVTQISVSKRGYMERRLTVDRHPESSPIEIMLQPRETGIFGKLTDAAGLPVKFFTMRLTKPGEQSYFRIFNNETGSFLVDDIPAGVYDAFLRTMSSPPKDAELKGLDLRRGYMFGEVIVSLPPDQ